MSEELEDRLILEDAAVEYELHSRAGNKLDATPVFDPNGSSEKKDEPKDEGNYSQWALGGNGRFSPVGGTTPKLMPGIYEPFATPGSWGLELLNVSSDEIYELPDMATNTVIEEAETFWTNEARYRTHNLLYKRGILLHGPPGSGKTVTVKLLMEKLIKRGGIVMLVHNVSFASMCLKALRRIEPTRNLICIFEDIDEIMHANGEAALLSLLDGENNVDRVLNIATTNFPERLGPRIINRPSRFDRRIKIGMPTAESRKFYIEKATHGKLSDTELHRWVVDTDTLSIAHLRELVAAVYCLDQPYHEVIERLKEMAMQVKPDGDLKTRSLGFVQAGPRVATGW